MGVKAGSLESKVLYGLRPRRIGVTVLSIRLPNFTFFKIALHNKVLITYFLGGELQKLIGSQRQHSEHQMRHDLARGHSLARSECVPDSDRLPPSSIPSVAPSAEPRSWFCANVSDPQSAHGSSHGRVPRSLARHRPNPSAHKNR